MTSNIVGMRKCGIVAGAVLMLGGVAVTARADETVVANVPFAFIVGDSNMPAGEYIVKQASEIPGVLAVESLNGTKAVFALTIPDSPVGHNDQAALVFQKFENRYFLSRIMAGDGSGREIVLTPQQMEKEMRAVATD